jgi:hypothetical protein
VLDAGVFFVDRRTGRLRLAASFGYDPWVETIHEALVHADPPQTGIETPRGLLTGDSLGARYPALRAVNERLARSFAVAVPVKPTDLSDGVMMFGFSQERGLSGAEAVLLDTLAGQCAIAVERAELLRRTREIADHLQSSLAASPLPENPSVELAAHYAPGGDELEHVGGDWYDVVETTGGGTAIVVGDVMGRGVQAATSMIRIRGGIRGLLTVDPTPDVVLDAGDRLLLRDAPEQFVTAMCVLVDPAAGLLFLSNAGHVPALVIDTDGTVAVVESASGVPLGVPHEEPRSVEVLPIGPGTTVVLVTDGGVETRERDLDEGIAGLAARAAALAGAPLQELVDGLAALAGDNPDDDVTVLAARLT